ncbi:MAG: DegT/DnrJ/EryC1/StrS family aminotransferase [Verrucomicrobia bacterium]|nr:DegT/DnrJ/EryC1/StrS family aminotransferase [Verrucomicrobiota bacterium]
MTQPAASAPMSRRKFVATNAAALVAAQLPSNLIAADAAADRQPLAKNGGPKTVRGKPGAWVRWDAREQAQVKAAIEQASLFYWAGRGVSKQTALFVERFKQHCPREQVMTCSSGTAAVHIAVAAAGIGPGDEVITSPVTDFGTVTGILFQQGVPVFADLGAATYNLDPAAVERAITPKTKAIIAVHLAGTPCDLAALKAIADKHKLILIEDCAQAWGAKYRGQPIGTIGHVACFSLMNSKHIGTGDGGVVASSDPRIGPALLKFGDKGFDRTATGFTWDQTGVLATNYRMSELQAAFGAAQLERLEAIAAKRAALGRAFIEEISGLPAVVPPELPAADRGTFWFFYFRLRLDKLKCTRAEFVDALKAEGAVASAGYIPVPVYRTKVFREHAFFAGRWPLRETGLTKMDYSRVQCPEAEAILATGVQCPLNESMDEAYVREIGTAVRKVAKHFST